MEKLSFNNYNLTLDTHEVNDIIIEKDNFKRGFYVLGALIVLITVTVIVEYYTPKSGEQKLKNQLQ